MTVFDHFSYCYCVIVDVYALRDNKMATRQVKRVIMAHVFAKNVSKFSSDIFSYKYQNCFCCLTAAIRLHTKLCEIWVKHIFV